mmetsp:Transcript_28574/g.85661  ORF Transcript_28574/g.85661 Transcript_28574/m.85661 type:complete len:1672 (+) Transcript_28574:308-5323(+)
MRSHWTMCVAKTNVLTRVMRLTWTIAAMVESCRGHQWLDHGHAAEASLVMPQQTVSLGSSYTQPGYHEQECPTFFNMQKGLFFDFEQSLLGVAFLAVTIAILYSAVKWLLFLKRPLAPGPRRTAALTRVKFLFCALVPLVGRTCHVWIYGPNLINTLDEQADIFSKSGLPLNVFSHLAFALWVVAYVFWYTPAVDKHLMIPLKEGRRALTVLLSWLTIVLLGCLFTFVIIYLFATMDTHFDTREAAITVRGFLAIGKLLTSAIVSSWSAHAQFKVERDSHINDLIIYGMAVSFTRFISGMIDLGFAGSNVPIEREPEVDLLMAMMLEWAPWLFFAAMVAKEPRVHVVCKTRRSSSLVAAGPASFFGLVGGAIFFAFVGLVCGLNKPPGDASVLGIFTAVGAGVSAAANYMIYTFKFWPKPSADKRTAGIPTEPIINGEDHGAREPDEADANGGDHPEEWARWPFLLAVFFCAYDTASWLVLRISVCWLHLERLKVHYGLILAAIFGASIAAFDDVDDQRQEWVFGWLGALPPIPFAYYIKYERMRRKNDTEPLITSTGALNTAIFVVCLAVWPITAGFGDACGLGWYRTGVAFLAASAVLTFMIHVCTRSLRPADPISADQLFGDRTRIGDVPLGESHICRWVDILFSLRTVTGADVQMQDGQFGQHVSTHGFDDESRAKYTFDQWRANNPNLSDDKGEIAKFVGRYFGGGDGTLIGGMTYGIREYMSVAQCKVMEIPHLAVAGDNPDADLTVEFCSAADAKGVNNRTLTTEYFFPKWRFALINRDPVVGQFEFCGTAGGLGMRRFLRRNGPGERCDLSTEDDQSDRTFWTAKKVPTGDGACAVAITSPVGMNANVIEYLVWDEKQQFLTTTTEGGQAHRWLLKPMSDEYHRGATHDDDGWGDQAALLTSDWRSVLTQALIWLLCFLLALWSLRWSCDSSFSGVGWTLGMSRGSSMPLRWIPPLAILSMSYPILLWWGFDLVPKANGEILQYHRAFYHNGILYAGIHTLGHLLSYARFKEGYIHKFVPSSGIDYLNSVTEFDMPARVPWLTGIFAEACLIATWASFYFLGKGSGRFTREFRVAHITAALGFPICLFFHGYEQILGAWWSWLTTIISLAIYFAHRGLEWRLTWTIPHNPSISRVWSYDHLILDGEKEEFMFKCPQHRMYDMNGSAIHVYRFFPFPRRKVFPFFTKPPCFPLKDCNRDDLDFNPAAGAYVHLYIPDVATAYSRLRYERHPFTLTRIRAELYKIRRLIEDQIVNSPQHPNKPEPPNEVTCIVPTDLICLLPVQDFIINTSGKSAPWGTRTDHCGVWSTVSFQNRGDALVTAINRRRQFEDKLAASREMVEIYELHMIGRTAGDDRKRVAGAVGSWVSSFVGFGMSGGLRAASAKLRGEYRSRLCDANLINASGVVLIAQGVGATAMLALASEIGKKGRPCTVLYRGNDPSYAEYIEGAFGVMGIIADGGGYTEDRAANEDDTGCTGRFRNCSGHAPYKVGRGEFYNVIQESIEHEGKTAANDSDHTVAVAFCGGEQVLWSIQAIANSVDKANAFTVEVFGEAFPSHSFTFTKTTVRNGPAAPAATTTRDLQPAPLEGGDAVGMPPGPDTEYVPRPVRPLADPAVVDWQPNWVDDEAVHAAAGPAPPDQRPREKKRGKNESTLMQPLLEPDHFEQ